MAILAAMAVPHPPIILHEIGKGEERRIQKTIDAYNEAMKRALALQPDTIILTSPHAELYADYFHITPGRVGRGDFSAFRAPEVQVEVPYDEELAGALEAMASRENFPAGFLGVRQQNLTPDHGAMIPLDFLRRNLPEGMAMPHVLRLSISGLSNREHYHFGELIRAAVDRLGRRTVFIASGDLSHKLLPEGPYGFAKEGPVFDKAACKALGSGDFLSLLTFDHDMCEGAAECGLRSFWIMAGALDRRQIQPELLSYEGPFGVGYGVAYFALGGEDVSRNFGEQLIAYEKKKMAEIREREDSLVRLARKSLESFVRSRTRIPVPSDVPSELLSRQAGAFVSIKKDGALRGCIGTFLPTRRNLAEEILQNAISAGTQDPRFDSVQESELGSLVYDVDVLTEPVPVASPKELDPKRYGIIVQAGDRRGLLLPDLAGIDTVEEQIAIARKKGNINDREPVQLYRFEVERHV